MITDCYDITTEPFATLKDFYGEKKHILDTCLIIFSKEIHTHLLNTFPCEEIAVLRACNGDISIYRMNYKGTEVAFYLTGIGSAIALLADLPAQPGGFRILKYTKYSCGLNP